MICPYCRLHVHFEPSGHGEAYSSSPGERRGFDIAWGFCASCKGFLVLYRDGEVHWQERYGDRFGELGHVTGERIIHPHPAPPHVEPEVPETYRADFIEATLVMPVSPKASAAMTRRILQSIIREECGLRGRSLHHELELFVQSSGVPSSLLQAVDAIRNLGNIAAHPTQDISTGEILTVEEGEAEWLLEVVQALFNHVFVQPRRLAERRESLNAKLSRAGKPPLK